MEEAKKPSTERQIKVLRRYGCDAQELTFDESAKLLGILAANGWKWPSEYIGKTATQIKGE